MQQPPHATTAWPCTPKNRSCDRALWPHSFIVLHHLNGDTVFRCHSVRPWLPVCHGLRSTLPGPATCTQRQNKTKQQKRPAPAHRTDVRFGCRFSGSTCSRFSPSRTKKRKSNHLVLLQAKFLPPCISIRRSLKLWSRRYAISVLSSWPGNSTQISPSINLGKGRADAFLGKVRVVPQNLPRCLPRLT